jgi:hypothetical protein
MFNHINLSALPQWASGKAYGPQRWAYALERKQQQWDSEYRIMEYSHGCQEKYGKWG